MINTFDPIKKTEPETFGLGNAVMVIKLGIRFFLKIITGLLSL